jgi:hypothetical protein
MSQHSRVPGHPEGHADPVTELAGWLMSVFGHPADPEALMVELMVDVAWWMAGEDAVD